MGRLELIECVENNDSDGILRCLELGILSTSQKQSSLILCITQRMERLHCLLLVLLEIWILLNCLLRRMLMSLKKIAYFLCFA